MHRGLGDKWGCGPLDSVSIVIDKVAQTYLTMTEEIDFKTEQVRIACDK
jgi:hypothetical protein